MASALFPADNRTANAWPHVLTAMATPFDSSGAIYEEGVSRLVEHLLANGSDGLVVSGTTGESPTLSHAEKVRMFGLVRECVAGRGPVIAGSGDNETATSIELSKDAQKAGVDALLLVTPYYNRPSQEGLYRHFRAVAEAVSLPIMVYNVPPRTGVNLEAATVLRLARDVPNVVCVKEASSNLLQATDIITSAPKGFALYSGEDGLVLPLLSIGAAGVVSVSAHLVGRDMKAMHLAYFRGDHVEAARLHNRMHPIVRACFQPTTPSPAPVKAGLNLLGVNVGGLRLPLVEATDTERDVMRVALHSVGLL